MNGTTAADRLRHRPRPWAALREAFHLPPRDGEGDGGTMAPPPVVAVDLGRDVGANVAALRAACPPAAAATARVRVRAPRGDPASTVAACLAVAVVRSEEEDPRDATLAQVPSGGREALRLTRLLLDVDRPDPPPHWTLDEVARVFAFLGGNLPPGPGPDDGDAACAVVDDDVLLEDDDFAHPKKEEKRPRKAEDGAVEEGGGERVVLALTPADPFTLSQRLLRERVWDDTTDPATMRADETLRVALRELLLSVLHRPLLSPRADTARLVHNVERCVRRVVTGPDRGRRWRAPLGMLWSLSQGLDHLRAARALLEPFRVPTEGLPDAFDWHRPPARDGTFCDVVVRGAVALYAPGSWCDHVHPGRARGVWEAQGGLATLAGGLGLVTTGGEVHDIVRELRGHLDGILHPTDPHVLWWRGILRTASDLPLPEPAAVEDRLEALLGEGALQAALRSPQRDPERTLVALAFRLQTVCLLWPSKPRQALWVARRQTVVDQILERLRAGDDHDAAAAPLLHAAVQLGVAALPPGVPAPAAALEPHGAVVRPDADRDARFGRTVLDLLRLTLHDGPLVHDEETLEGGLQELSTLLGFTLGTVAGGLLTNAARVGIADRLEAVSPSHGVL